MKQLETPILLIIFNRIDTAQKVFNEIRKQRPKKLFISADGPRKQIEGELEQCLDARRIVQQVDWPCLVTTNFKDENSGSAGIAVSEAISWFFHHVDRGIIFEHDVIPHPDYFAFCEELLERYKDNERISVINGVNFQDGQWRGDGSYYFSKGSSNWGFATWRRFWQHYDLSLSDYPLDKFLEDLDFYGVGWKEKLIRADYFKLLKSRKIDDWAFQVHISMFRKQGLSIVPNVNLITNIGGGEGAFNLKDPDDPRLNRPIEAILPLHHPSRIERDIVADEYSNTQILFKPVIYIPLTDKAVRININNNLIALMWFSWRWFRRTFIIRPRYSTP